MKTVIGLKELLSSYLKFLVIDRQLFAERLQRFMRK